jgi:hypothetical protein
LNTLFHATANTTAALELEKRFSWSQPKTVLWASIIPDVPLLVLTLWYFIFEGMNFGPRYDDLFYENAVWVVSHNLFHAPFTVLALGLAGALLAGRSARGLGRRRRMVGRFLLSCSFATGLHSIVDIFTHHDDGPLLLFPFEWSLRFSSPISYWDPEYYGRILGPIDLGLTLLLGAYLVFRAVKSKRKSSRA